MPRSYRDQITIEKSPWSFMSPVTAPRIHKFNKTIKMILLVRDPVSFPNCLVKKYMLPAV